MRIEKAEAVENSSLCETVQKYIPHLLKTTVSPKPTLYKKKKPVLYIGKYKVIALTLQGFFPKKSFFFKIFYKILTKERVSKAL